jgi:hypothetical protein
MPADRLRKGRHVTANQDDAPQNRMGPPPRPTASGPLVAVLLVLALLLGGLTGWIARDVTQPGVSSASPPNLPVVATPQDPTTAASGASEPSAEPEAQEAKTLQGTLQLTVNRNPKYPENCRGFGEEGYGDIAVGTRVTVTDGSGTTLGVGELEQCEFHPLESPGQARGLRFSFSVSNLPPSDFYRVEVASRGSLDFSREELQDQEWEVQLSL